MPVIGYQTEELPAFYTRKSGFKVDYRMDTPAEIAEAFRAKMELGLDGSMLVTNPIPEEYSMDHDAIYKVIDEAIAKAKELGIHGKETTPYLLDEIQKITGRRQPGSQYPPGLQQCPSGFCHCGRAQPLSGIITEKNPPAPIQGQQGDFCMFVQGRGQRCFSLWPLPDGRTVHSPGDRHVP